MSLGKAIDLTILPYCGYSFFYCTVELSARKIKCPWLDAEQPLWAIQYRRDEYAFNFMASNLLFGFGSYWFYRTVLADPPGDKQVVEWAFTMYGFHLVTYWSHYGTLRFLCQPLWAAMNMTTSMIFLTAAAYNFFRYSKASVLFMIPHVAFLAQLLAWDLWAYGKFLRRRPYW